MTTLHTEHLLTPTGWAQSARLHLRDGHIAAIERDVAPQSGDERHTVIVPAMANLHSHAFQRGMAGFAETRGASEDNFWSWRDIMYRFASRMSPEHLQAIAAQAYVEMLEAGYGRVGEFHYVHHDIGGRRFGDPGEMVGRLAAAAAETGLSLTLLPVFYAHSSFGGKPPHAAQSRFIHDIDSYARLLERCHDVTRPLPGSVVGVAPHSLRAVTPVELTQVVQLLPEAPVHIHIAEQMNEVRDCVAWSGLRPVRWLLDHADVDSRWCLVHATHVDDGEIDGMARSGATVGLCPVTEANLGDGIFPAAEFIAAGGRFGVGTDSNVCIGLPGELSLLEYTQRLSHRSRNVIGLEGHSTGVALFRRALAGGVQALGAPAAEVIEGGVADLVSLSGRDPAMLCRAGDALIDSWLFAAANSVVDCVWVGGNKLVEGGRHRSRDPVRQVYEKTLRELCA